MANVQLEHGYLRLANALDEAIMYAEFTATQLKIVHCIIRLTYGWQQNTVRIARPAIAERCRVSAVGGGFNRAFDELLEHGVIIEVRAPSGRSPATFAINKDYEHWGRFSVASAALETLFGERPDSGRPALQGGSTDDQPSEEGALQGPRDQPCRAPQGGPTGPPSTLQVHIRSDIAASERQERQERQIKSGVQERGDALPTRSPAPLREALSKLPSDAIAFLKRFYPHGKTTTDRRVEVAEQIIATLANGTPLRDGQIVRAYSPERLAAKCRHVMRAGVRDRDKAIVVLLAKLADTSDDSAPGVTEARAIGIEEKRVEREATGELLAALSWLEDRPDVVDNITRELEAMGLDPGTRDEDLAGELLVINRRITRNALILAAWREAGAPQLVTARHA